MPQNFTQDLTFETDELGSLATILRAGLQVTGYLTVYAPEEGRQRPLHREYASESAAFYLRCNRVDLKQDQLHYAPICRVYRPAHPDPYDTAVTHASADDAVKHVLDLAAAANPAAFTKHTGEGPFAGSDGLVRPGYRLHASALTGG